MTTTVSRILKLAACTNGMTSDMVHGITIQQVSKQCSTLVTKGLLHKVVINRRHVRYFTEVGVRDAFLQRHISEPKSAVFYAGTERAGHKAPWGPDDEAIVPEGLEVIKCPSHEPRFTAIELPNFYAGNQRGRVAHRETA